MWTALHRPQDIAVDFHGLFYICEGPVAGSSARVSVIDDGGTVLARWDSRSAHGLWVDSRGNIYLALVEDRSVDKYVRVN